MTSHKGRIIQKWPNQLELLRRRVRRYLRRQAPAVLQPVPEGIRVHVGAGQNILAGYENVDAYDNDHRPQDFQTPVTKFVRAELLDTVYKPESVAEIRCHHLFEHVSMLDVDRMLQGWNRVMKTGGLVWIEVPDFEGCSRQILRLRSEDDKEIYYRHIFGCQTGPGELHKNGLTATRLIHLLARYGFETKLAYVRWSTYASNPLNMCYPKNLPLPDLHVQAIKTGPPDDGLSTAPYTPIHYRKVYPNPEFSQMPMGKA